MRPILQRVAGRVSGFGKRIRYSKEAREEGSSTAPDSRRRRKGRVGDEEAGMPAANPKKTL